jgi:hypothetical protein
VRQKPPTPEELVRQIRFERKHWKDVHAHGTTDPFYEDGTNLNLVRNHVIYYQEQLRELCKAQKIRPCPKEAREKPPRHVSEIYMAPRSKAAKYSIRQTVKKR